MSNCESYSYCLFYTVFLPYRFSGKNSYFTVGSARRFPASFIPPKS